MAQAPETLNLARQSNLDFDPRSVPEREWLETWYAKFKVTGDENLHERLVAAWTAYAEMPSPSLPLGMVDIIELRRDYRLREKVDCESPNPILADLLKQLSSDGKLLLSVAEKTDPRLTVASNVSFHGPLYEAMPTIAEPPGIQGQWERIENGYQIHSAIKSPRPRDVTPRLLGGPRMWLVLTNIVVVLAVCRFFWHRDGKRSSSSGVPN